MVFLREPLDRLGIKSAERVDAYGLCWRRTKQRLSVRHPIGRPVAEARQDLEQILANGNPEAFAGFEIEIAATTLGLQVSFAGCSQYFLPKATRPIAFSDGAIGKGRQVSVNGPVTPPTENG